MMNGESLLRTIFQDKRMSWDSAPHNIGLTGCTISCPTDLERRARARASARYSLIV